MNLSPIPIVLIGFMGSGKSTVGRALAARLGREFLDLDLVLEATGGRTIADWFATAGEAAFRRAERATLAAMLDRAPGAGTGCVIALGGGAYAEPATQELLDGRARILWLDVPLATIRTRIRPDGERPLYRDPAEFERLFAVRRALYARADLRIDADAAPEAVVERIVQALQARDGPQAGGF